MIKYIFFFSLFLASAYGASKELVLGFLSTQNPLVMQQNLQPFLTYLEQKTGHKVVLRFGHDYLDTVEKIADGTFDIAYLGPIPYIKAKKFNPSLQIIASLKNQNPSDFTSAVIVKKGSQITKLEELKNKSFAFGSRESTLSYYIPMMMLKEAKIDKELKRFDFLGRHDRVAQYVIMGKYDAGSVKYETAQKYAPYLEIIAQSEQYNNFIFVASSELEEVLVAKIRNALLSLETTQTLKAFDNNAQGFEASTDADYDALREVYKKVESFQ